MKGFRWTGRMYTSDTMINLFKMFPVATAAHSGKVYRYTEQLLAPPSASPLTALRLCTASSLSTVAFPGSQSSCCPSPSCPHSLHPSAPSGLSPSPPRCPDLQVRAAISPASAAASCLAADSLHRQLVLLKTRIPKGKGKPNPLHS